MELLHLHQESQKRNNEIFLLLVPPFIFSLVIASYVILNLTSKNYRLTLQNSQNQAVLGNIQSSSNSK